MRSDSLRWASVPELLIHGPTGDDRPWAATFVLRMLEAKGAFRYRGEGRLRGEDFAQAAVDTLRTAISLLTPAEQPFLLRTILLTPWEDLRRATGLTVRLPLILAAMVQEVGVAQCAVAVQAVIAQGLDAVREYPLAGLLPEHRQPGEGLVIALDARDRRPLNASALTLEIDQLTLAVKSLRGTEWENNLRPLVFWRLDHLDGAERRDTLTNLVADLPDAARDDQIRWRSLGLLDWFAEHPQHPEANKAVTQAAETRRADVRKAAAVLAGRMARWDLLETLSHEDPDRGVRERAKKILTNRG